MRDPCLSDEPPDNDDRVRELDERIDHLRPDFGTDVQLAEPTVVPGIGALDHPPTASLQRLTLRADLPIAAQPGEEIASLPGVIWCRGGGARQS